MVKTFNRSFGFTLTDELKAEVTDRIEVKIGYREMLKPAVEQFGDYIKSEVLADSLELSQTVLGEKVDLDGVDVVFAVTKK